MTGSVALDVVIGLVFIYLLYSLLATILLEIIATNLGFRARNLKIAIIRMLSNESFTRGKLRKFFWQNILSLEDREDLAVKFYKSPIIKYLNSGSYFSKPSSISPKTFSSALIQILSKGSDQTPQNVKK